MSSPDDPSAFAAYRGHLCHLAGRDVDDLVDAMRGDDLSNIIQLTPDEYTAFLARLTASPAPNFRLQQLLLSVTPENIHPVVEVSGPVGTEER